VHYVDIDLRILYSHFIISIVFMLCVVWIKFHFFFSPFVILRKNKLSFEKLTKLKDTFVHSNKIYRRLFNIEAKCLKLKFDDRHHTNKSSSDVGYKKLYTFFMMRIKYMALKVVLIGVEQSTFNESMHEITT
jgi:hypothetical protein